MLLVNFIGYMLLVNILIFASQNEMECALRMQYMRARALTFRYIWKISQ